MKKKLRVAILFGGRSAEHEVSLRSAQSIIAALDKKKYEPVLIGIDKAGRWLSGPAGKRLLAASKPLGRETKPKSRVLAIPEPKELGRIDVVFPVLHGPYGEDGTVQGMLKLAGLPFVGPGVLGSAVGMDKDIMKRLLRDAGLPIGKFLVFQAHEAADIRFKTIQKELGLPFFIKPANLGSSVGISKVHSNKEFNKALTEAFQYDSKVIIEENIIGREIECSVLGNEYPVASLPGEVIPAHDFYSYDAKYIDEQGAAFKIPADLPKAIIAQVQALAVKAFKALGCEGMGRVDMFITKHNKILLNEINTIPGFTSISMYPKLWEASGLPYPRLLDALITLALERFRREQKLKTARS